MTRPRFMGTRGGVVCETRHFPIVLMRFEGALDLDALQRYDAWQEQHVKTLVAGDHRVVWVADVRAAQVPPPDVRRWMAERWRHNAERYRAHVIGEYVVADSSVLRVVFALFRLINPRLQVEIFVGFEPAMRRARAILLDAGIEVAALSDEQLATLFD